MSDTTRDVELIHQRLRGFMDEHVYPAVPLYNAEMAVEGPARWKVVQVLEEVTTPNWVKKVLKGYEPMRRMIFQGKGEKARALFDRADLPRREQAIRNRLKREKLWLR